MPTNCALRKNAQKYSVGGPAHLIYVNAGGRLRREFAFTIRRWNAMPRTTLRLLVAAGLLIAPGIAMAHPGHGTEFGLAAGLAHPWSGIDHVLAMTAVGLLAARLGGRALWAVPSAFLGLMALGGLGTAAGLSLPFAETAIALSVAVFGFAIASRVAPPVLAAMALVGVFAVFHGHVHVDEMPANASALAYGIGFLAATALLHGLGIGLGLVIGNGDPVVQRRAVRISGLAIGLVGTGLLLGAI
jgi:urease accessory protein